jgi:uncharacterized protein
MSAAPLDIKLARAEAILRDLGPVAVAFSGGVDSALVLKLALNVLGRSGAVAVTSDSASVPRAELDAARRLADELGAEHVVLATDEFEKPDYLANPANRCYFCKTTLYDHMVRFVADRGLAAIVNGVNADDLGDYRPGLKAAGEHAVRAPLAEAGLTKAEVRELSARFGLPTADKPASPCLSSRVPYGEAITVEKLRMIEAAEAFLHQMGVRDCRVRHHDKLARIEVPTAEIPRLTEPATAARIDAHFRSLGYAYVSIDLRGLRSGSLNEVIAFGKVQQAF